MPKIDRQSIYERDGGLCGFCGLPVPRERFHIDHITPRAMGGDDEDSNRRLAHVHCNISAGSRVRVGFTTRWNGPTDALALRIPTSMIRTMRQLAESEERSINYIAARLLRQAIDEQTARVPIPKP